MGNLLLIIAIYISTTIVSGLIIDIEKFPSVLFNIIPYLALICLIIDFENKNFAAEIFYFTCKIYVFVAVFSIVMFFLGYSKVEFTISNFFSFIPTEQYINEFGEGRLSGFFSHKTRYAVFCLIGITFFLINEKYTTVKKFIYIMLLLINIYLSDSMTVLFASMITILFFVDPKKINKNLKIVLYIITLFIIVILSGSFIAELLDNRNIYTLGARKYIWQAAIEYIGYHPFGVVMITEENYLYTSYYGNWPFTNAHNHFLNEFIQYGFIGGLLFILFYMKISRMMVILNKKLLGFFLSMILVCMMESSLSYEMLYVFLYGSIVIIYKEKNKNSSRV